METWKYGYFCLIVGIVFEIFSFLFAHICQLIFGYLPISKCRTFVIEYYFLSGYFNFSSERADYLLAITIITLLFGAIGLFVGYFRNRKHK